MEIMSHSLDETEEAARLALDRITTGKYSKDKALVIGLVGDLGSGKTTFVKSIAKLLEIKKVITSPTFVLQKSYSIPEKFTKQLGYNTFVHIDAYRLESGKELKSIGWDELVLNKNNLILLEWPERVEDILDGDVVYISFEFIDEKTRKITWKEN